MSSEERYRADTHRYMVTERGRLPYDSRLTEEIRVPDNYVPKKELQLIEIYPMPTDPKMLSYELDRLDHEWQKKWFKENGDINILIKKRGNGMYNAISSLIQKYRTDLGEYHRNDETYVAAHEEFVRKNKEVNELNSKRNDIRKALEKKKLRSISMEDANKLGWIIENDPKYTIHNSTKFRTQYVYPNEFKERWTGEKVPLSVEPIWLGETIVEEENDTRGGYKSRISKKMRKSRKICKSNRLRKTRKTRKTHKSRNSKRSYNSKRRRK